MRVRVVYLGILKDLAGKGTESVEVADGARVSDLWLQLVTMYPKFKGFSNSAAVAVNQDTRPGNEVDRRCGGRLVAACVGRQFGR